MPNRKNKYKARKSTTTQFCRAVHILSGHAESLQTLKNFPTIVALDI